MTSMSSVLAKYDSLDAYKQKVAFFVNLLIEQQCYDISKTYNKETNKTEIKILLVEPDWYKELDIEKEDVFCNFQTQLLQVVKTMNFEEFMGKP